MPTINSLLPPYPTFLDAQGNPLNGGFIYIGQPGLEARTTPKASYFDEALTIPTGTATGAAVRTSAGYPVGHNGSPANVYVDGDYSITVTTSAGVVVFSALYPGFTFDIGATGGPILAPDGNLAATGFGFVADQNTGFIRPADGQVQTVANGVVVSTATETGTVFAQPLSGAGWASSLAAALPTATSMEASSLVAGDLLRATGPDALTRLAIGTNGHLLQVAAGIPAWASLYGASSLTFPNGFIRLPNNLHIMWGSFAAAGDSTTFNYSTISGSISLSIGSIAVVSSTNDGASTAQENTAGVVYCDTTGFRVYQANNSAITTFFIAIGA